MTSTLSDPNVLPCILGDESERGAAGCATAACRWARAQMPSPPKQEGKHASRRLRDGEYACRRLTQVGKHRLQEGEYACRHLTQAGKRRARQGKNHRERH